MLSASGGPNAQMKGARLAQPETSSSQPQIGACQSDMAMRV